MSDGYQIKEQDKPHFLTLQVVNWVDVFTRKRYKDIVIESLKYCIEKKSLEVYAFVIMSNHVHLVARSGNENLSQDIADFKKFTSKSIISSIKEGPESRRDWMLWLFESAAKKHKRNKHFQFWTHENHPIQLYSDKFTKGKVQYIHENPVRAGIVSKPEDYLYSSARNYAGLESMLEIEVLTFSWTTYN